MSKVSVDLDQVKVKNGVLPKPDELNTKEDVFPKGLREMVEENLQVELLHVEYPNYDGKIFVPKITSVWGESKPVFFPLSDLIDKKKREQVVIQLVNRGIFDPERDFEPLLEYIRCLIRAGLYKTHDTAFQHYISETEDLSENEDSLEYYKLVVEYIPRRIVRFFRKEVVMPSIKNGVMVFS